ncbi:iron-containing alcohol dehydrogenase [Clostridium polynesiense]|uniref:iron-containing alcohol dehydrogenase n=1 Tax=Clostridium polynesiense TaxID=1325933 RepID=UPI0006948137|nr:iron-containing alcohol dehydrogenase [Clostridium polynesiense]
MRQSHGSFNFNGGELEDYIGLEKCTLDSVPLIAVNTTAGTASEISRACLIIDTKENRKIAIKDKHAIPLLAVNDSMLMLKLPAKLTAATGMDALTHAIESYTSQNAYAVSKCSALEAVGLIFKYLDKACEEPQNIEFRDNMIYAEFLAGISFCNSGLGLVHAMSHQLSSTYGLPHGLSNAVLLPYVMEFNAENIPELYDELYLRYHWEEDTKSMKPGEATELLIQEVRRLSEKIGTNVSLEKLNVKKEDFEIMAEKALIDGCYGHTPVKASKPSIIEIYNKAYLG